MGAVVNRIFRADQTNAFITRSANLVDNGTSKTIYISEMKIQKENNITFKIELGNTWLWSNDEQDTMTPPTIKANDGDIVLCKIYGRR